MPFEISMCGKGLYGHFNKDKLVKKRCDQRFWQWVRFSSFYYFFIIFFFNFQRWIFTAPKKKHILRRARAVWMGKARHHFVRLNKFQFLLWLLCFSTFLSLLLTLHKKNVGVVFFNSKVRKEWWITLWGQLKQNSF